MNTCGGMVCMLASSEGRCGFETQLGKTKDYKMSICCFCAKYAVWRSKIKEGFWVMCQSEANCPPIDLFQSASIIKIQLRMLV